LSRFISPITNIKANSTLNFFKSGTNSRLITYKDQFETIENVIDVEADSFGNLPNIFFSGSAKVLFFDEFEQQYASRDPVGGEKELGSFVLWDVVVTYDKNDISTGDDGKFYISLSNGNIGNNPTTDDTKWEEWPPITRWNTNVTPVIGDVVQSLVGNLWKALTATAGNDPETDNGTNWIPAIDGSKIAEVTANTVKVTNLTIVIPQTVSGELTAARTNELQDAGAFTLPLASSVDANTDMIISQPLAFVSFEPTVTRAGSDTITINGGTDTDILFDNTSSKDIRLTSDGVSAWRLTV